MIKKKSQVEQLTDYLTLVWNSNRTQSEQLAKTLVENGWKKDPCSVGAPIYWVHDANDEESAGIYVGIVEATSYDNQKEFWINAKYTNGLRYYHKENQIGSDLYFDLDAAEKELNRRREHLNDVLIQNKSEKEG